jgi:hypothetical protein
MRPSTRVVSIDESRIVVKPVFSGAEAIGWRKYLLMPGEDEVIEEVDWVVPAIGRRSREDLYLSISQSPAFERIRVERVGDCVAPRLIQSTIVEAFELGRAL